MRSGILSTIISVGSILTMSVLLATTLFTARKYVVVTLPLEDEPSDVVETEQIEKIYPTNPLIISVGPEI